VRFSYYYISDVSDLRGIEVMGLMVMSIDSSPVPTEPKKSPTEREKGYEAMEHSYKANTISTQRRKICVGSYTYPTALYRPRNNVSTKHI
jgi:hypothetical protein